MTKKELAEKYFELSNLKITMPTILDLDRLPLTREEVWQTIKDSMEEVYTEKELIGYINFFSTEEGNSGSLKVASFQKTIQDKLMTAIFNKQEEI